MKIASFVSTALAGLAIFCCSPVQGASCVTSECHPALSAITFPHAPVKEGDCSSCHTQRAKEHPLKGGKSFELSAKGGALCANCHSVTGKQKFQHDPAKEGECISCHKPHGSSARNLLDVTNGDQTPLCLGCHESGPFKQKFMHGPAAVGNCTECHDPHQAAVKALLKEPVRNLCLKCHADFAASMKEAVFVHPPVKEGPCSACHNPHGSAVPMFLKMKSPELCLDCHTKIKKSLAAVKVPHKPVQGEGGCSNCHSAHFSKAKALLSSDEMSVCLGCHGTDKLGSPPLRNIKKDIEGKKFLHGPIKQGSCKACHDPHGSANFRMLRGAYPKGLYAPYTEGSYDGCLICHEKNLLRFPDTTIYTKFRNGNRNLHWVHVAKSRKGRTCRICHQPHASDGEKLINKEGSPFGDWKIPLNFVITPTGGGCLPGCHRAFRYDREKPVAY